ncbi:hypothetical protein GB937_005504 [Aspergillus fischeri]|nr:hypothetical protein GB937_005504 [Aspergillus fischeri]
MSFGASGLDCMLDTETSNQMNMPASVSGIVLPLSVGHSYLADSKASDEIDREYKTSSALLIASSSWNM